MQVTLLWKISRLLHDLIWFISSMKNNGILFKKSRNFKRISDFKVDIWLENIEKSSKEDDPIFFTV